MHRQEDGERQAGKPVHQRRDPKHALAVAQVAYRHGSTTAMTARAPRRSSSAPKALAKMPAPRSSSGDHSVSTLRTPIAAWMAAATTKAPENDAQAMLPRVRARMSAAVIPLRLA